MSVVRMVVCFCLLIASAGSVLPMALDLTFIVEKATLETSDTGRIASEVKFDRTYQTSHQKLQILAKDQRKICLMSKTIQCAPSKQYALRCNRVKFHSLLT